MTKKDFLAIARAIHGMSAAPVNTSDRYRVFEQDAYRRCALVLADVLAASNPRFDRQRFIKACEEGS